MIRCNFFYNALQKNGFDFFTGVPDSVLKNICAYIDTKAKSNHIIAANEGNAIGIATGYYLSTGKPAVVYFQNSGLGNAINPLTSLTAKKVYSIPMLLIIGWRGGPGEKDEPQHKLMGGIQNTLLKTLDIPWIELDQSERKVLSILKKVKKKLKTKISPVALIVKKNTFYPYKSKLLFPKRQSSREVVLEVVLESIGSSDIVVSTTGKTSREIFELREKRGEGHEKDFLTVGSMGHVSSIALGIAHRKPSRKVWCIDGDGSIIMHMGNLTTIGNIKPKNLIHVVINNFAHESVGGQPTSSMNINFGQVAKNSGFKNVYSLSTKKSLKKVIKELRNKSGPSFLEIQCKIGSRVDLGRPTIKPAENKRNFMKFLK